MELVRKIEDLKEQLWDEQEKFNTREIAVRPILVAKVEEHEPVGENKPISYLVDRL